MDAIAYIRWSTLNQEDGNSLERQESLVKSVAKQRGWNLTEVHIESGKSAYHGRNRAQKGKLRAIEDRAARGELAGKVLIVEAMDRLSRQEPIKSLTLLTNLCERGLTICEAGSGIIYDAEKINSNWGNLVVALAKAGEAHDSSKLKAGRVSKAWRKTQETGKTREGTDDPRLCPAWMEVVDGKFTPIEPRADMIREMFQHCIDGWGLRKISQWANEKRKRMGWPQAAWHVRTVTNLIHGRRVVGEYQPQMRVAEGRTDTGEAVRLYPAIISEETWHRAQASLKSRSGTGGPREKCVNILTHLCRCQHRNEGSNIPCGHRMSLRRQKRGPAQLVCADFARAGLCKCNASFRYDDILNGILDNIARFAVPAPEPGQESTAGKIAIARAELQRKKLRLEQLADENLEKRLEGTLDEFQERAFEKAKARYFEDEAALKEMERGVGEQKSRLPRPEVADRIAALRPLIDESVDARMAIQAALDQLIDVILMDAKERTATVVMLDGMLSVKFSNRGEVLGIADALTMLQPRTYMMSDGTMATFDPRPDVKSASDPMRELVAAQVIDQRRKAPIKPR